MSDKQPLPVIVIGGVYEYGTKRLPFVVQAMEKGIACGIVDGKRKVYVGAHRLTGPVAMPCPLCGKVVQTAILPWHMNSECSQ